MAEATWHRRLGHLGTRTVLVLAVLGMLVAALDRSGITFDCSADHRYTLSPALIALIDKQQAPIELVSIWPIELDDLAQPLTDGLSIIAARSPHINLRHIDPLLHKPTLATFEQTYGPVSVPAIYVVSPSTKRAFYIPVHNSTRLVLQRDVGGALVTLGEGKLPHVELLQGHGELRPGGGLEDGNDELIRALQLSGLDVHTREIARDGPIDPNALLVIAGPTIPLGSDLAAVRTHLIDGGACLMLVDDRCPQDLAVLLRERGILLDAAMPRQLPDAVTGKSDFATVLRPDAPTAPPRIVVSLNHHAVLQEAAFPHHNLLLDDYFINPDLELTRRTIASGQSVLSPWTTTVQILQPDAFDDKAVAASLIDAYKTYGTPRFTAAPILQTAAGDAWTKQRAAPLAAPKNLENKPILPLAWAITSNVGANSVRSVTESRLMVWGSRQAASNGVLAQRRFGNATLLCDVARWCLHQERATEIPEAETHAFRVDADDGTLMWITILLIAVIPCIFFGAAMLTWWDRR